MIPLILSSTLWTSIVSSVIRSFGDLRSFHQASHRRLPVRESLLGSHDEEFSGEGFFRRSPLSAARA